MKDIWELSGEQPQTLKDRPKLDNRQLFYHNTFAELSSSRSASMGGVMPIPIGAIKEYCEFFDITSPDDKDRIFNIISAVDRKYLTHLREKQERESKKSAK